MKLCSIEVMALHKFLCYRFSVSFFRQLKVKAKSVDLSKYIQGHTKRVQDWQYYEYMVKVPPISHTHTHDKQLHCLLQAQMTRPV